jgi:hypothetical protein
MMSLCRLAVAGVLGACMLVLAGAVLACPCLVSYPGSPCTYHFNPAKYYTVGPGNPLYNPLYDRGGRVLIAVGTNTIDLSVYEAPQITGFVADTNDDGYFFEGSQFDLVIDGFASTPTTFVNVLMTFDIPQPVGCVPQITVDGEPVTGTTWPVGDLVVRTPTPDGRNYSGVTRHHVAWTGCVGLHVWAFSDPDHVGIRTHECLAVYSHNEIVPVQAATWSAVKSLYR